MRNGGKPVRIILNPDPEYAAHVSVRLKPDADPASAERAETLVTMLAELNRTRTFIAERWRMSHPVKAHHALKSLRQIERQFLAELEELYGAPVEIDPPRTEQPLSQAAAETEDTVETTQEKIHVNGSDNEPGSVRRAANKTWQSVKNPKVWGVGAAIAGIGLVYLIVRAVAGDGETAVVEQASGQPNGPIGGGDTATSTTVDPAVNG
jgi:hypothetical protein